MSEKSGEERGVSTRVKRNVVTGRVESVERVEFGSGHNDPMTEVPPIDPRTGKVITQFLEPLPGLEIQPPKRKKTSVS